MKTIVLPGFSRKNKEWANEVKENLTNFEIHIHEWKHWETENSDDFVPKQEVEKIMQKSNEPVNIIAKSVGTFVSMLLIKNNFKINKLVLNGLPISWLSGNNLGSLEYANLNKINANNVLIIQNENDPLASFEEVKEFVAKINKDIKVIKKDRSDHHYPFYEDFREFLKK